MFQAEETTVCCKGPEVVFSGIAKRPKGLSGESKGERGETGDVDSGLSL